MPKVAYWMLELTPKLKFFAISELVTPFLELLINVCKGCQHEWLDLNLNLLEVSRSNYVQNKWKKL